MERRRALIPTLAIIGWSFALAVTVGVLYGVALLAMSGHAAVARPGGVGTGVVTFLLFGSGLLWLSRSSRGGLMLVAGKVRLRTDRVWSAVSLAVLMGLVTGRLTGSLLRGVLVVGVMTIAFLGLGLVMFLAWRRQIRPLLASRKS